MANENVTVRLVQKHDYQFDVHFGGAAPDLRADEPPPLDDADDWRRYFADRLPKLRVEVVAPAEVEHELDAWKAARAALKAAEKAEALAKNKILSLAVAEQATAFESKHGRVLVVQAKDKAPYVKAPTGWTEE